MNNNDPSICPLCGRPNQCAMMHPDGDPMHCWCRTVDIPKELLDQVPPEKRGRACICQACIKTWQQHSK